MSEKRTIFTAVSEKEVTRAIVYGFAKQFIEYVESDCLVIGGGPSGLIYSQCGGYLHPERPCWEVVYTQGEILTSIPKDCKNCKVYRLYRKFPDPSTSKV